MKHLGSPLNFNTGAGRDSAPVCGPPQRRAGKSLIEMTAVISIMAVVTTSGMRLMHVLLRAERTGTHKTAETAALAQLIREFRRDVHAASDGRIVPAPAAGAEALELTQPDGREVVYIPDGPSLVRRELREDELLSQRRFRLPARAFRFEQQPESSAISLHCDAASAAGAASGRAAASHLPVRVVAILDRDRRFERQE